MAHSCPVCDLYCTCGGDIDDLCFDDTKHARQCSCCDEDDDEPDYEDCDEGEPTNAD